MDPSLYADWIGRVSTKRDMLTTATLGRLSAVLDHPAPPWTGNTAPPLAHWLAFLPDEPQSQIGEDGHPKRGGFYPPLTLPRRMFAGARLEFPKALPVDVPLERRASIIDVTPKTGASGDLVFVTVRYEVIDDRGGVCVVEEQDIVFRGPDSGAPQVAKPDERVATSSRVIMPDPTLLLRYSALTFNAHRIHYDRDYARHMEGYPALVVHGPLIATLLMDHGLRAAPGRTAKAFSFRAKRPLFDDAPFTVNLAPIPGGFELWARDLAGGLAMDARLEFAA